MRDAITVLHISDMQFGKFHRFAEKIGSPPNAHDTLTARLIDDLQLLSRQHKLTPDLIICTGDLAERGLPKEFHDAFAFLAKLCEHYALPRDRCVVIPGNHDINRSQCSAYFEECKANSEEPAFPWFPKWKQYKTAFDSFYAGLSGITFAPEQPWTLFIHEELCVVVAGLNSTMDEGHDTAVNAESREDKGHHGLCEERQYRWFKQRLSEPRFNGWLRIGAVHHNTIRGCRSDDENLRDADLLGGILGDHLHLLLHGHTHEAKADLLAAKVRVYSTGSAALKTSSESAPVPTDIPNQYQLLRVERGSITRYCRQYAPRNTPPAFIGDVRQSKTRGDWVIKDDADLSSVSAITTKAGTAEPIDLVEQGICSHQFIGRASTASTLPGFANDFYTEPAPGLLDGIERSLRDNGVTFLYGPPGSGKSMTASEVAKRSDFAYRFWLNAENELTLIDSLAAAQREMLKLKVDDKDDVQSFAKGLLEALASLSGWLLIYDNVADLKLLEEWLPRSTSKPAILITTQNHPGNAFAGRQIAKHELDELEEDAALLFFLRRAGHLTAGQILADAKPDDRETLYRLFADLGRLPLALEAAAHVCSKGVSIGDYHRELTQTPQPKLWGDDEVTTATRHPGLHRSLTVLFERVKSQSPEAFEILMDAAWLEPDRVPTWLLTQSSPRTLPMLASDRLLVPLDGIRANSNGNDLRRIHREHQFHLRGMLDETTRRERLEKLIERLQLPSDLDYQLWRTDRTTGRRFEGALPAIVRLSDWANRLQLRPEARARLQHAQAVLHFDSANHGAAEKYCRDALSILGECNLTNTVLFASLQQQLAVVLNTEYRTSNALDLLDDSLVRLDALEQSHHPCYADSLQGKASALLQRREKGDIDAALDLLDKALHITKSAQGKSHPNYAVSLNGKARALLQRGEKGDIDTALALLDEDLRITEASQGKSHPSYASSLHGKANALLLREQNGDIDAALDLLDEALRIKESSQGKSHPSYAVSLHGKASLLLQRGEKGDIDAALILLDEALRIKESLLGKSVPGYANSLRGKAAALLQRGEKGDIDTALALLDEELRITEASQGKNHPSYAGSLYGKARALLDRGEKGDIDAALHLLDEDLLITEESQGKSHPSYAASLVMKGNAYLQRKQGADLRRAWDLLDEAWRILKTTRGVRHLETARALFRRGVACARQGRLGKMREGLQDMDEAVRIAGELFPGGHSLLANFLTERASLLRALGQQKAAAVDASRAAEIRQKFGRDHDIV